MRYSIITICYNSSKTIERTIQSVLAQTCKNYEYIIVDGGSKDNTLDIVRKYEPMFERRMKWVSEPDNGIYNAMNKGILRATGDIIGICNSDDWLEPNALEIIDKFIDENNINVKSEEVITGWMNYHYDDGTIQIFRKYKEKMPSEIEKYDVYVNHPATFVSSITYKNNGSFDENLKLLADADLMIRLFRKGINFHFIHEILTNQGDGGASTKIDKRKFKDKKYILDKYEPNKLMKFLFYWAYVIKQCVKWIMPKSVLKKKREKDTK